MFGDSDNRTLSKQDKNEDDDMGPILEASNNIQKSDDTTSMTLYFNEPSLHLEINSQSDGSDKEIARFTSHLNERSVESFQDSPNYSMYYKKFKSNGAFENVNSEDISSTGTTSLLSYSERRYLESRKRSFHFIERILNNILSPKNFLHLTKIFNLMDMSSDSKQDNLKTLFFSEILNSSILELFHSNVSSNDFQHELILNFYLAFRRYPRIVKMLNQYKNLESNNTTPSVNVQARPSLSTSITTSDATNHDFAVNRRLNLLCIIVKNDDFSNITSKLKQSWANEDIKIVLPINWNIVASTNVVTITDDGNQSIRIFFRNSLNTRIYYKYLNEWSRNDVYNNTLGESIKIWENNRYFQNKHERDVEFPLFSPANTTYSSLTQTENKYFRASTSFKDKLKNNLLPLEDPLLLKYMKGKQTKQVLMYKNHSIRNFSCENNDQFSKTLEHLIITSVRYEGDPIHLIFNPLKVIRQLKRKQKTEDGTARVHSSETKLDHISQNNDTQNLCKAEREENRFFKAEREENRFFKADIISHVSRKRYRKKMLDISTSTDDAEYFKTPNLWRQKRLPDNTMNNEQSLSDIEEDRQDQSKLKLRRRKKSRTAYKRVNARKIVSSVFREFFHFYSLHGGHLRSGSVITRSNSNHWLQVSGVVTDSLSLNLAGDLFRAVAGTKVVLNIYDYLKFLTTFALRRNMIVAELVKQMMVCERSVPLSILKKQWSIIKRISQSDKSTNVCESDLEIHTKRSRSLPNLRCF